MGLDEAIKIVKKELEHHKIIKEFLEGIEEDGPDKCIEYRSAIIEAFETVLKEVDRNGLQ